MQYLQTEKYSICGEGMQAIVGQGPWIPYVTIYTFDEDSEKCMELLARKTVPAMKICLSQQEAVDLALEYGVDWTDNADSRT
ncbi:hypothetical protein [Collimonas sp.]|jgi:hypothetical protein|uniref:hypothetical protein n=1 Tax=Collimonas sp. TaxID=1963772 RepID=UPI002CB0629E|nr:hypothetical protein [Collimonas sp.]HWW99519.1 hypothetical protein [Collimonas sp.]